MTDTAVSYSYRANARHAAEKMIGDGTVPAVDYGIKPRDDGRFEVVWKTGNGAPATTEEIETEITTTTAAAETEAALPPAPAATEAAQAETAPQRAPEAGAAPQPAPAAAAPIGGESEPTAAGAGRDPELADFEIERLIAELERRGYRSAQARQRGTQRPATGRQPSRAAQLNEAAAHGVMPTKPDVTSHANHHHLIREWADIEEHRRIREFVARTLPASAKCYFMKVSSIKKGASFLSLGNRIKTERGRSQRRLRGVDGQRRLRFQSTGASASIVQVPATATRLSGIAPMGSAFSIFKPLPVVTSFSCSFETSPHQIVSASHLLQGEFG
jgi:hypothetical protein